MFSQLKENHFSNIIGLSTKKNAQKQPKQNNKNEIGVVEKEVLNSKKFGTLRLFSHVVSGRFIVLPPFIN